MALYLAFSALTVPAHAFDLPSPTDYWVNMTQEEVVFMLDRIAAKTETRDVVLVCYPADGGSNISTAIKQFSVYANDNRAKLYGYAYTTASQAVIVEKLTALLGVAPTEWPVAVTYNTSFKQYLAREYVTTMISPGGPINGLRDLMIESGLQNGSHGEDPDPGTDPDPSPTPAPPSGPVTQPTIFRPFDMTAETWNVLRLTNQHRMEMGLAPLSVFAELQDVANLRAEEIYQMYLSNHARPNGTLYYTAYAERGAFYHYSAENIASGQRTSESVMNSWLNSPGHRANIENAREVHLGVGYCYGEKPSAGRYNWTQDFAMAGDCRFSSLKLSASVIPGTAGASLDSLISNITVSATCYRHGTCYLPLISAMCSGYDPNAQTDQTVTVTYGGQTAELTIVAAHNWGKVTNTKPADCTNAGVKTYTCTDEGCDATWVEEISALGHDFTEGSLICSQCGGETISSAIEEEIGMHYLVEQSAAAWTEERAEQYVVDILNHTELVDLSSYDVEIETVDFKEPVNGTAQNPDGEYGYYQCKVTFSAPEPDTQALAVFRMARDADVVTSYDLMLWLDIPPVPYVPSSSGGSTTTYYAVTAGQQEHGKVTANRASMYAGGTVILTVVPDEGYRLEKLAVTDSRGEDVVLTENDGTYTFKMPGSSVKVVAEFVEIQMETPSPEPTQSPTPEPTQAPTPSPEPWENPFPDVSDTGWYIEAVRFAATMGLMSGYDNGKFGPNDTVTRAQFAQIIYNKEGRPDAGGAVFSDVTDGWYADAVNWAAANGIVAGVGGGKFAPALAITRQDLAVILWKYAGMPEPAQDDLDFTDAGKASGYAWRALCWANENGILNGRGEGILDPKGEATRAETAQILMNYLGQQG